MSILIVEAESIHRSRLQEALESAGFIVSAIGCMSDIQPVIIRKAFDVLVMDVDSIGGGWVKIVREVRQKYDTRILLTSNNSKRRDLFVGIEAGADDFVCGPFMYREFIAKIRNMSIRKVESQKKAAGTLRFEGFEFNTFESTLRRLGGEIIPLTRGERDILRLLLMNRNRILDRDELASAISQGQSCRNLKSIDVLIHRLRVKISDDSRPPKRIESIYGEGYVLNCRAS